MSDTVKEVVGLLAMVVGVALAAVALSPNSQTTNVIRASSSGFAGILGVAMGGAAVPANVSSATAIGGAA